MYRVLKMLRIRWRWVAVMKGRSTLVEVEGGGSVVVPGKEAVDLVDVQAL
jgi:hypothetical protein